MAVRTQLNFSEVVALGDIVKTRYKESGLDFTAFTANINETPAERKLFRKDLTVSPVKSMAESLGIESNRPRRITVGQGQEEFCVFLTDRVAQLEQQVEKLALTVARLENIIKTIPH